MKDGVLLLDSRCHELWKKKKEEKKLGGFHPEKRR